MAAGDRFPGDHQSNRYLGPATRWFSITKHDTDELTRRPRAIRCNGAGDIRLVNEFGDDVVFTVAAGEVLDVRPIKVMSTNTTATGIVGLD